MPAAVSGPRGIRTFGGLGKNGPEASAPTQDARREVYALPSLTVTLTTDPAVLRLAWKLLADFVRIVGGSHAEALDVEVAVGEIFANAYYHAYGQRAGPLRVEISYAPPRLQLLIQDHGAPLVDRPTIPAAPPAGGTGLGLYMVGRLMDEAEVIHPSRASRGTAVRMVKRLRAADSPTRGAPG